MAVSLSKGGNVSLSKEAPGLTRIKLGLGWETRKTDGAAFDLDVLAFGLTIAGKARSDSDFVFFNNKANTEESIRHSGDNRTGQGEGDDESVFIDLARLGADVDKVVVAVVIFEGKERNQTFGQVEKAYVRVVNEDGGAELARYDLTEDASTVTAMIFGELYRKDGEWKFKAVGQGYEQGFEALVQSYGVSVG